MIVISIDQSTKKQGVTIWSSTDMKEFTPEYTIQIDLTGGRELPLGDRMQKFAEFYSELFTLWKPDHIVTENPSTLLRIAPGETGRQLCETFGLLRYLSIKVGRELHQISPMQAKIALTGSGRAKKPDMIKGAQNFFPCLNITTKEEDKADSLGIGMFYIADKILKIDTKKIFESLQTSKNSLKFNSI